MSDAPVEAQRFDALYAECRDRLLVLAFASTGDLPASRGAVRDAFVAAWHHWPKVKRLDDPESWVRPHAWTQVQRRHTARIWHRDRRLDPEVTATLDALARLATTPRKALLLTELSDATPEQTAREVGVTLDDAAERLRGAVAEFAGHRGIEESEVRPTLARLAEHCAGQRWPRATIVRRSGSTRRRTHALAGAGLIVAALVGSGFLVTDQHGVHPTLAAAGDRLTSVPTGGPVEEPPADARITPASLISTAQLGRALPGRRWRITGTDPAQGMTFPCQRRQYADPEASVALVRNFTARRQHGKPQLAVVQAMELSSSVDRARAGYAVANRWFATCSVPRMQLLGVRRIVRLGEEAQQYALRSWSRPTATFVLGVARTGRVTTLTLTRTPGAGAPDLAGNARVLTTAVNDLCPTTLGGHCSALPKARDMPAPPAGSPPMMLAALDLPPAAGVSRPWVGTTPKQPIQNAAATGCDASSFRGADWTHGATRSFLVPGGGLAASFGITETVGRLPDAKALSFVAGVRSKLASCPHRELGTRVLRLASGPTWSAWRVRTQVSQKQTVTFFMGIVRSGGAVAQVGFVPDGVHTMTTGEFVALVHRAGERLAVMPE